METNQYRYQWAISGRCGPFAQTAEAHAQGTSVSDYLHIEEMGGCRFAGGLCLVQWVGCLP